jgi:hypothetical protein
VKDAAAFAGGQAVECLLQEFDDVPLRGGGRLHSDISTDIACDIKPDGLGRQCDFRIRLPAVPRDGDE